MSSGSEDDEKLDGSSSNGPPRASNHAFGEVVLGTRLSPVCTNEELYTRLWAMQKGEGYVFDQSRQVYYAVQRMERPTVPTRKFREEWHSIPAHVKQIYRGIFLRLKSKRPFIDPTNLPKARPQGGKFQSAQHVFDSHSSSEMTKAEQSKIWARMTAAEKEPYVEHFFKLTRPPENYRPLAGYDWTKPPDDELPLKGRVGKWLHNGFFVFREYHMSRGRAQARCLEKWNTLTPEEQEPYLKFYRKNIESCRNAEYVASLRPDTYNWLANDAKLPLQTHRKQPLLSGAQVFREYHTQQGRTRGDCIAAWERLTVEQRARFENHYLQFIKPTQEMELPSSARNPPEPLDADGLFQLQLIDPTSLPVRLPHGGKFKSSRDVFETHATAIPSRQRQATWARMSDLEREPYSEHFFKLKYGHDAYVPLDGYNWGVTPGDTLPSTGRQGKLVHDAMRVFQLYHMRKGRQARQCDTTWVNMTAEEQAPFIEHFNRLNDDWKIQDELPTHSAKGQWLLNGFFVFREYHMTKNNRTPGHCLTAWKRLTDAERSRFTAHFRKNIRPAKIAELRLEEKKKQANSFVEQIAPNSNVKKYARTNDGERTARPGATANQPQSSDSKSSASSKDHVMLNRTTRPSAAKRSAPKQQMGDEEAPAEAVADADLFLLALQGMKEQAEE